MKCLKKKNAYAIQDPLLEIRIHGNNLLDRKRKMFFREFYNWYSKQKSDEYFTRNKTFFLKKLIYLLIVSITPNFIKNLFKKK